MGSRIFTASYRGVCAVCEDAISPGEDVRYDEHEMLVHWMCPDAEMSQPSATPCPRCRLIHVGDCF